MKLHPTQSTQYPTMHRSQAAILPLDRLGLQRGLAEPSKRFACRCRRGTKWIGQCIPRMSSQEKEEDTRTDCSAGECFGRRHKDVADDVSDVELPALCAEL